MAPEVLTASGHDQRCDWWSVGVILYEMVVGCPPFYADDPAETQNKVINYVHYLRIPADRRLSAGVCALIHQLCCDKDARLGACGDAAEVKTHEWFAGVNFENIRNTNAPHRPTILHATDTQNFDAVQTPSDEAAAAIAAAAAVADTHKQHDRPTERKGRKGNNGKHKRGANPAFFEFTFRHFFDMEPLGLNGCQMPETTRPQQQRPSLAPLIEQQQQMMLLQQQQAAAAAQAQTVATKRTPPPPYPMGETNNNHILSAPIQMYPESHQQPPMLMMTTDNYNQRTPHEYYTQHDYV
jgi:serine/threonine protein kinase